MIRVFASDRPSSTTASFLFQRRRGSSRLGQVQSIRTDACWATTMNSGVTSTTGRATKTRETYSTTDIRKQDTSHQQMVRTRLYAQNAYIMYRGTYACMESNRMLLVVR